MGELRRGRRGDIKGWEVK
jgi:hypothetical protein